MSNATMNTPADPAALRNAMVEVREEAARMKKKIQQELHVLLKKWREEFVLSEITALNVHIAKMRQDFKSMDCLLYPDGDLSLEDDAKGLVNWNGIMKKHGVAGY